MLAEEELKDSKLLVFANKQDQKEAMPVKDITAALGLTNLKKRQWHIEKTSAIKNIGLTEGLEWLSKAIKK
jgi:signal recognition particle receptor subunit beta